MKTIGAVMLFLAAAALARADEPGFWQKLTPEERRAAGLEQLTPEQQRALDALAARYAADATTQTAAQTREAVREEVRTEVRREVAAEQKTKAAARAGLPADADRTVIRTRITGKTNGWTGQTVFHLANGQVWAQTDSKDSFWMPTAENPEVELRPGSFGWKLFLPERNAWVRVRRVQ